MSESQRPRTLGDSLSQSPVTIDHGGDGDVEAYGSGLQEWLAWPGLLSAILIATVPPWMIGAVHGSSRWVISVLCLIGLTSWWLESAFQKRSEQRLPLVLLFVGLGALIGLLQVMPLPDWLQSLLMGQQATIYETTLQPFSSMNGFNGVQSYLTLDREGTWDQLQLMILGLAALIIGFRFFRRRFETIVLLIAITLNGVALAFFGIVQKLNFNGRIYWIIELTQGGTPFGPYVNRNNAAGYLLLCLAACIALIVFVWEKKGTRRPPSSRQKKSPTLQEFFHEGMLFIAELNARKLALLAAAVIIASGLVTSLSRGGVLALIVGTTMTLLIYALIRRPKAAIVLVGGMAGLIVALTVWIGYYDKLVARFEDTESLSENARVQSWQDSLQSVGEMGLFGAGMGSYPVVQRIYGQNREVAYFEYAENQFVQSLIDAGIPGLVLLLGAIVFLTLLSCFMLYRGSSTLTLAIGAMGIFLVSSQCIASFFDFGWYIPANTVLLGVMVGVLSQHAQSLAGRLKKSFWIQHRHGRVLVSLVSILIFILCLLTSIALHRRSLTEEISARVPRRPDYVNLNLVDTETLIDELNQSLAIAKRTKQLDALARLWTHKARMMVFEREVGGRMLPTAQETERSERLDQIWEMTDPSALFFQVEQLRHENPLRVREFVQQPFVARGLAPALRLEFESLKIRPVQPEVQLAAGQIVSLIVDRDAGLEIMRRAVLNAPGNVGLRMSLGKALFSAGQEDEALIQIRKALELDKSRFKEAMDVLKGRAGWVKSTMPDDKILEKVVPEDADLLFRFAETEARRNNEVRAAALERARELLVSAKFTDSNAQWLLARVLLASEDWEAAKSQLERAIRGDRYNQGALLELTKLALESGDAEMALICAEQLVRLNDQNSNFRNLYQRALSESLKDKTSKSSNQE